MEFDNSVYSVTPPTLYLNENGPSIFLMGMDEEQVKRISQVYDTYLLKTVLHTIMMSKASVM